jgi:hypothetical protein
MTFDSKLKHYYQQAAHVADMGGYGLSGGVGVSGGKRRRAPAKKRTKKGGAHTTYGPGGMYPHSFPMPGFYPGPLAGDGAGDQRLLSMEIKNALNKSMVPPYGSGYNPMFENEGCGLSGGRRMARAKNPRRVAAGLSGGSVNPWLSAIAEYRRTHPNVSQKNAMIALGRRR